MPWTVLPTFTLRRTRRLRPMSVSLAILLLLLIPAFPSNAYSKIWPKTNILRKYGGDSKDLEWVEGSAHAVPKRHVGDDDALQFLLVLCGKELH
mmetsp:Transcript_12097/g.44134  ORF Transcript_12097/g.44134 Transcript_12097/m.44134 type:complete len:94 (-) Transcript_12097:26-307(-)